MALVGLSPCCDMPFCTPPREVLWLNALFALATNTLYNNPAPLVKSIPYASISSLCQIPPCIRLISRHKLKLFCFNNNSNQPLCTHPAFRSIIPSLPPEQLTTCGPSSSAVSLLFYLPPSLPCRHPLPSKPSSSPMKKI